ncbi:Spy/CpxP family protein refolding chaperone [Castellaniella caeni]|uniref:Spy/CpxP family protein refolding chaperone n=1 Tax=Castellaniella caeni TaxID=266123 RepID=UPI0008330BAD|nr:Spy/CpxP family protein refolding chaperone [Castellaniella caeni]
MTFMPTRTLSTLALAAAIVAAPLAASAANTGPADGGARHFQKTGHAWGHHGDGWLRGLDLTQAQQDQIFKIRHDQEQAVYDQKKAAKEAMRSLRELGQADTFDPAKAKQAADALGQAQGQLALLRAQTQSQIRAVLTPDQRQKLAERHTRHMGDKGGKGGMKS